MVIINDRDKVKANLLNYTVHFSHSGSKSGFTEKKSSVVI